MYLDPQMEESTLRELFGQDAFELGLESLDGDYVSKTECLCNGVYLTRVFDGTSEHRVLRRDHPDRILMDCDCGSGMCPHIAAMLARDVLPTTPEPLETDETVVSDIRSRITSLEDDILEDPDYDEDADYYDDWGYDRFNGPNPNEDVEFDHAEPIIGDILHKVPDTGTALGLIDELVSAIGETEFSDDGFLSAFSRYGRDLERLFREADVDTVAMLLRNRSCFASELYGEYIEHIPDIVLDKAYSIVLDGGIAGDIAQDMMFENGDYDGYVSNSWNMVWATMRVIGKLEEDGRMQEASKFASTLIGYRDLPERERVADTLSRHGYGDAAAEIYLMMFKDRPEDRLVGLISHNSESVDMEGVLADLMSEVSRKESYSMRTLDCLARNGHADAVSRLVIDMGFRPDIGYSGPDCSGSLGLCESLLDAGFPEASAIIGRGVITHRLKSRDSDRYQEAVDLLVFMDGSDEYAKLRENHTDFKIWLKQEYGRMRKFWGLYNGTWKPY